jgi:hypothetical protein
VAAAASFWQGNKKPFEKKCPDGSPGLGKKGWLWPIKASFYGIRDENFGISWGCEKEIESKYSVVRGGFTNETEECNIGIIIITIIYYFGRTC